jgi:hypothetical protein
MDRRFRLDSHTIPCLHESLNKDSFNATVLRVAREIEEASDSPRKPYSVNPNRCFLALNPECLLVVHCLSRLECQNALRHYGKVVFTRATRSALSHLSHHLDFVSWKVECFVIIHRLDRFRFQIVLKLSAMDVLSRANPFGPYYLNGHRIFTVSNPECLLLVLHWYGFQFQVMLSAFVNNVLNHAVPFMESHFLTMATP